MGLTYTSPTKWTYNFYQGIDSVNTGSNIFALHNYGFRLAGVNVNHKYSEIELPGQDGSMPLHDNGLRGTNLNFVGVNGQADDQDEAYEIISSVLNGQDVANDYHYLLMGLHNGSSLQYFRKYGKLQQQQYAYAQGTQHQAWASMGLNFRQWDPHVYHNVAGSYVISVSGGLGTQVISNAGFRSQMTRRVRYQVLHSGGGNPTDVVISNAAGESFTLSGSLTTSGDYWMVDVMDGTLEKFTPTAADDIANFSGQFPGVNHQTDTISVVDGGSASFLVVLTYLPLEY